MTIERKTNGYEKYTSVALNNRLEQFEKAVSTAFGCAVKVIDEFYYSDRLIMVDVRLDNNHYGSFSLPYWRSRRLSVRTYTPRQRYRRKVPLLPHRKTLS